MPRSATRIPSVLTAAALALGSSAVPAQVTPAQQLHIETVAIDRNGVPVADVRKDDLEVWIETYRVPIETLTYVQSASHRGGRLIVLVLDDVTVEPAMAPRVREVAQRFVKRMAPGDRMAVMALTGELVKPTDETARLLRSIDSYNVRATGFMRVEQFGEHVFNTLTSVARQIVEMPGKKIIVGIGSGWVFDTPDPPPAAGRDLRPEMGIALRTMALAHASLYVVDPGGLGRTPFGSGTIGFARETGGHAFMNTNDHEGAADRIMREADTYYIVTVADPPIGRKAELRELDVRSLRRGVTVRARRWIPGRR